ncbi:MAG TPA: hypothetical protein VHE80_04285 [Acidimicrobiales bacterium]|nr:hypothetical protein [Acidimicrobiales bacterium]
MARCEVCGNDYEASFEVVRQNEAHTFDCFECAIHALAPACGHCGCRVIGHGTDRAGRVFCCSHCARAGTDGDAMPVAAEAEEGGDEGGGEPVGDEEEEEEDIEDLEDPSQERLDEIAQEAKSVRQRAEEELTGPEEEQEDDEDDDEDDDDEDE